MKGMVTEDQGAYVGGQAYREKRALDIALSIISIILLSPVMLSAYIMVRIVHGKPVFFRQLRPGMDGKPFELLKFRSMTDERSEDGSLLPDAARLTALGRFIRRTSIDELPSVFNVLSGEMSFVGPRPLMMEYLNRYTPRQQKRHAVRPGITGLAQVSGRNNLKWTERFELDIKYVEEMSLKMDLLILLKTIAVVLSRRGIAAPGETTMYEFQGEE